MNATQTVSDSLVNHLENAWMEPERRRHQVPQPGMLAGRVCRQSWNIVVPMPARRQQVGKNNDQLRALCGTASEGCGNRRLCQFHVRRFYDGPRRTLTKEVDHLHQIGIAFWTSRTVVDKHDAGRQRGGY